jgi:polygalacturonase
VLDAISFRRIDMEEVLTPFVINSFYYCDPDGHTSYVSDRSALPVDERTPSIGKVCFEQIDCRGAHVRAVHIEGLPENKIEEAVFRNVSIRMSDRPQKGLAAMAEGVEESCAGGMFIRNVHRLVLDHVQIEGTIGPACDLDQIDRIEEGHS